MAAKRVSALDAAMIEQAQVRPAPAPEVKEVNNVSTLSTLRTPAPAAEQSGPVNRGGRPRGVEKVKKTLYLTKLTDEEGQETNYLEQAQKELGAARMIVKDDSEVVDLALAFLYHTAAEGPEGLQKIKALRLELRAQAEQSKAS